MRSGFGKGLAVGLLIAALAGAGVWIYIGLVQPNLADDQTTASSPTPGSPAATSEESPDGYFEAFWPVSSLKDAREVQRDVDAGKETWRTDPVEVSKAFVKQRFGWGGTVQIEDSNAEARLDSFTSKTGGSSVEGWTATVSFKHRFVRGQDSGGGFVHNVQLIGLKDADRPAWFVTTLVADWMKVDSPQAQATIISPIRVSGSGNGFEAQIDVALEDDSGAVRGTGFAMGGAYEPAPFNAEISFTPPSTEGGRVVFTPSSGAEGPPAFASIIRVRFAQP